jgi:Protein of unknown function (DUF2950)
MAQGLPASIPGLSAASITEAMRGLFPLGVGRASAEASMEEEPSMEEEEVTGENYARTTVKRSKELKMMYATRYGFEKRRLPAASAALAASALLAVGSVKPCLAGPSSQTAFPSPDEASRALVSAAQEDEQAVIKILGGGSDLIRSDDNAEDALERERFVQKYQEMHRWVRQSGGIATLYIGAENWPFPIPLLARNGVWQFDSKAGSNEILFRRIGENEVTAIVTCDTLVTPETRPGTDSDAARIPKPFHGYYFRILQGSSGGIAAIAYPAIYRSSGVMTFIATKDGGVSEKDLGVTTPKIAGSMTTYHADATWTPVEPKP